MLGRRNQWQILLWVTCVVGLLFSYTKTFAFSSRDLQLWSEIDTTQVKTPQVKALISGYCTQVLKSPAFGESGFVYNAKQSVFVHLLCSNIGIPSPYFAQSATYFKRTTFPELGFQDITVDQIDLCATGAFQNDCDLATNIPKLFNDIMNDYVNMKQPNLYGLSDNFQTDLNIVDQVNLFSSGYFNGIKVCETSPRSYPKTCAMMK